MDMQKFKQLLEGLKENRIILYYTGFFSQRIIEEIGETLKVKMEMDETAPNVAQKVFSIFIEQVQNVINYSIEKVINKEGNIEYKTGYVTIGQENNDNFYIISGNIIGIDEKSRIVEYIDKINQMDIAELKNFYKQKMKNSAGANKKSAGIGLIDMLRKSSKPIEYFFDPFDNNNVFFTIKVTV